jgi:MFS family permease
MSGLRIFYVLTVTQVLSLVGSRMTGIAVGIRIFGDTGAAAPVLLTSFFSALPMMVGGGFAGTLVDRWERRIVLIVSDVGQALGTALLLLSFVSGRFQLWHLYTLALLQGLLAMFQQPAMEASVTMLVPEGHRDRANTIRQMSGPAAGVLAPVVTGLVYAAVGVNGVIAVDLLTCVVAVTAACLVRIPRPRLTAEGRAATGSIWREMLAGGRFVWQRRILFYLMLYAALINFLLAGPISLTTPYVLTLTGSEEKLGILLAIMNAGMLVGGIGMGIWGGTRPRIHGIMLGLLFRASWLAIYGVVRQPVALGLALFFVFSTNALVDASFMSILQLKVPADMQGRVFALLFQMMYVANPLSLLLTGLLVDRVLTPAVGTPGWAIVTPLVGSGSGSGMGLVLLFAGTLMFAATLAVYAWPRTRRVERELPDYVPLDQAMVAQAPAAGKRAAGDPAPAPDLSSGPIDVH